MKTQVGAVFAVPLYGGKFTLCRIVAIGTGKRVFTAHAFHVAVSKWRGKRAECSSALLASAKARAILVLTHHGIRRRRCVLSISTTLPNDYRYVGHIEPTRTEARMRAEPGAWESVRIQSDKQWEWENDREVVLRREKGGVEVACRTALEHTNRSKARSRRPSFAVLARRKWFAAFRPGWSAKQVADALRVIQHTVARLSARERDTRRDLTELRAATYAFNRFTRRIMTPDAEEIHEALCEIAAACNIDDTTAVETIDAARDW